MKPPRPRGRPNQGLAESPVRVGMTAALLSLVDAAARKEGVSRPEWIRRAVVAALTKGC